MKKKIWKIQIFQIFQILFNPLSAIGKYTDHWKFDIFMILDP